MTTALLAGAVAGYGVALPIGAIGTYLVGLGAREPLRTSAAAALGVATTDGLFALLAAVGGVTLAGIVRPVARPVSEASAVVLLGLAIRTLVMALRRHRFRHAAPTRAVRPVQAYARLVALTAANPSTLVFFLALVLGGTAGTSRPTAVGAGAFAAGAFLASASWQLALAGGGAALGRLLTGPRGRLAVAVVSAAVMAALAARLLWS